MAEICQNPNVWLNSRMFLQGFSNSWYILRCFDLKTGQLLENPPYTNIGIISLSLSFSLSLSLSLSILYIYIIYYIILQYSVVFPTKLSFSSGFSQRPTTFDLWPVDPAWSARIRWKFISFSKSRASCQWPTHSWAKDSTDAGKKTWVISHVPMFHITQPLGINGL